MLPILTCDLFSALIDSRAGATVAFAAMRSDWPVPCSQVYDRWDGANKALQLDCGSWVPFAELSRQALQQTYDALDVDACADRDVSVLLASMAHWPLWPDVEAGLAGLAGVARVGVLSNVDDALLHLTRAAPLVDPTLAMTSERLRAYKPQPSIYRAARHQLGPFVHVASSARDVRGAVEAGLTVLRLVRPGHRLDPQGPTPPVEITSLADLPAALCQLETII